MPKRQHILVLDTDEYFLTEIERLLENRGFATTTTWASEEAKKLLTAGSFDLILIGDHPPDIDAREWLSRMRGTRFSARCLVLHPTGAGEAHGLGSVAIVRGHKPTTSEVLNSVEEQLGLGSSRFAA